MEPQLGVSSVGIKSIGEEKSRALIRDQLIEYRQFNLAELIRVFPSPVQAASAYLNPLPHWNAGCQLVSFHHDMYGKCMIAT
jgi:hypothetical protein